MGISIIIPAYNEENYLGASLESVNASIDFLQKTIQLPYEVIVVNNASTDATREVAEEYGAIVIDHDIRNISSVRNCGIKAAQYKWIVCIDADCELESNCLSEIYTRMKDQSFIGASLNLILKSPSPKKRIIASLLQFIVFNISGIKGAVFVFDRDEALSFGGFPEEKLIAEDSAFAFLLKKRAKEKNLKFDFIKSAIVTTTDRKDMSLIQIMKLSLVLLKALFGFKLNQKNLGFWYNPDR